MAFQSLHAPKMENQFEKKNYWKYFFVSRNCVSVYVCVFVLFSYSYVQFSCPNLATMNNILQIHDSNEPIWNGRNYIHTHTDTHTHTQYNRIVFKHIITIAKPCRFCRTLLCVLCNLFCLYTSLMSTRLWFIEVVG